MMVKKQRLVQMGWFIIAGIMLLSLTMTMGQRPRQAGAFELIWSREGTIYAGDFGNDVAFIGDVNNDGISDLAVGAYRANVSNLVEVGRVYLLSGATGTILWETTIAQAPGYDQFGKSVSAVGDVNGDGTPDVLVGAPGVRRNEGRIYLLSGRDGTELARLDNPDGVDRKGKFGFAVCGGPSFIVVGAPLATPSGIPNAGSVFLYSWTPTSGWQQKARINGESEGDLFGWSISCFGQEILIGAIDFGLHTGKVYLFDSTATLQQTWEGPFRGRLGTSVSLAGNRQVLIGASFDSPDNRVEAGSAFLYQGATLLRHFKGREENERMGSKVQLRDLDGNGSLELLIASNMSDSRGRVYAFNADGSLIGTQDGETSRDFFGTALDAVEGANIVAVGAPGFRYGYGKVYLFRVRTGALVVEVTQITPNQALNYGVLDATIIGSGFRSGATVWLEKNGQVINGTHVVVESATNIRARFDVADKLEGNYDVVVRNPDGGEGRLRGGLTLLDATPQVTSVNPNEVIASAAQNRDTILTIGGNRFLNGVQVRLEKNGQQILAKSVTFKSQRELDAIFDFTNQPVGVYDVVVKNPNNKEGKLTQGFNLKQSSPSIASIDPRQIIAAVTRTATLRIFGSGFFTGAKARLERNGIQVEGTNVQVVSEREIQATFDLTEKPLGRYNVVVENTDGGKATLSDGFTFLQSEPNITSINPTQIVAAVTKVVTMRIFGSQFFRNARVRLEREGVQIEGTNVQVINESEIQATFDLTNKPFGRYSVVVENTDGGRATLPDGFAFLRSAPSISTIDPTQVIAAVTRVLDLKIYGTGFFAGAKASLEGNGVQVEGTNVRVVSEGEIRATFDLTNVPLGKYDVIVENTDGGKAILEEGLTLRSSQPSISSITPSSHENLGTIEVQIFGSEFLPNAQVKLTREGETDITALQVQFVSRTQLKATFNLTAKKPGNWRLIVQNPDGGEATGSFTLVRVSPRITSIIPDQIPVTGEDVLLEIQGEKFLPGSEVTLSHWRGQRINATVREESDRRILVNFSTAYIEELDQWEVSVTHPFAYECHSFIRLLGPRLHLQFNGPMFLWNGFPAHFWIRVWNSGTSPSGAVILLISGISPGIDYKLFDHNGLLISQGTAEDDLLILQMGKEILPGFANHYDLYLTVCLTKNPEYEFPNGANPPVVHVLCGQWARKVLHAGGKEFVQFYNEIAQKLGEPMLTEENEQKVLQLLDEFLEGIRTGAIPYRRPASRDIDDLPDTPLTREVEPIMDYLRDRANMYGAVASVWDSIDGIVSATPRINPISKGMMKAIKYGFDDEVKGNLQAIREQAQRAIYGVGGKLPGLRSKDPNIKIGSSGVNGFITPDEILSYEVHFENEPEATGPVREVRITDVLDDNLDLNTFAFEEVNFSGRSFQVSGQSFSLSIPHSYTFKLGEETFNLSMTVTIEGSLDKDTRTILVRFEGLDSDIGLGFLPPNKTHPEGEGFFRFSIKPKADTPSGAQIKNKATIVFDMEAPMDTNEHVLTLDREPPNVRIAALPPEQPSPSFPIRWEGKDDTSGIGEIQIWVSDNGGPFRLLEILGLGGRAIPYEITFKGKFGHEYRFYAVARDKVGNQSRHPEQPQAVTRAGIPPRIAAGLKIVTLPIISEISDPKQVFNFDGDKWAWYDPMTNQYVRYPATATALQVGKGFWARFVQEVTPNAKGDLPDYTKPFAISLKQGWNLIGNPWLVDSIWDLEAIQVQVGNETRPLMNARGIIEPYAWRWNGNAYQLVFDSNFIPNVDNKIHAWEGAWVYAWQDCNLILPAPEGNRSRKTRLASKKPEGWFASLVAQVDGQEGKGFFGIAPNTRLQIAQPPSPPESQNNQKVQVLFLDKNGNATIADFRTSLSQRQEWEVLVEFGTRDAGRVTRQSREVTLTFDGIGYAPKDVNLWLVDIVTGKRLYMRTQSAYRFVASEGETSRRFKVIAEAGNTRPLQVVGLKAVAMRGRSLAIEFALTKAARTEVEVLTLTGRKVAVLEAGQNRMAGKQQIVWQGRSINGEVLPASAYLIRVIATDDEGRQVQATTVARLR